MILNWPISNIRNPFKASQQPRFFLIKGKFVDPDTSIGDIVQYLQQIKQLDEPLILVYSYVCFPKINNPKKKKNNPHVITG